MVASNNPDYRHAVEIAALRDVIESYTMSTAEKIDIVLKYADDRDRHLEDFLNRHVVRRVWTNQRAGNASHLTGSLGWYAVTPLVSTPIYKAYGNSELVVATSGTWLATGTVGVQWVATGVRLTDPDGVSVDTLTGSLALAGDGPTPPVFGCGGIPAIATGAYTAQLIVRAEAAAIDLQSYTHGTLSLTVTETPIAET